MMSRLGLTLISCQIFNATYRRSEPRSIQKLWQTSVISCPQLTWYHSILNCCRQCFKMFSTNYVMWRAEEMQEELSFEVVELFRSKYKERRVYWRWDWHDRPASQACREQASKSTLVAFIDYGQASVGFILCRPSCQEFTTRTYA